MHGATNI